MLLTCTLNTSPSSLFREISHTFRDVTAIITLAPRLAKIDADAPGWRTDLLRAASYFAQSDRILLITAHRGRRVIHSRSA
ncbi:hypothetical protein ACNUDN_05280 [Mycobacterium sp. smrl_JER01]